MGGGGGKYYSDPATNALTNLKKSSEERSPSPITFPTYNIMTNKTGKTFKTDMTFSRLPILRNNNNFEIPGF